MRTIQTILFLLITTVGFTQKSYYSNPVKIPMLLSGSFAELRSNHFHSGIDIKTQGTTGFPIYAAAEGYISRISVSPSGFGNALYITHPNGTTTLYGHLQAFSPAITKYVKNIQYENLSFRVDLQIPDYLFPVKQNQEIAKSGNTGSSGGPHLHFEIRDTNTEEPLNPLKYNFPVTDTIAPKIFSVLIVPLTEDSQVNYGNTQQSFPAVFYDGKYHLKNNPTLPVSGKIGVAVQTNDYFNGSYNKCGINLLQMSLDEETYFMFQLNRFSFDNSRFINSHIVYDEYINSRRKFIKTWEEPGNQLPIYNHNGTMGIISPLQDKFQQVEIELQDSYGNTSVLNFSIKGVTKNTKPKKSKGKVIFDYTQENQFHTDSVELIIPEGALYKNFNFEYSQKTSSDKFYSDYHFIHNKTVPLHTNATIRIKPNNLPHELKEKVIMANVDKSGEFYAVGGEYKNGWVETNTRTLGTYAIVVDTIAPTITSLSIKENTLTESNRIRFKITDDLAGIKTIKGLLDGKWALFNYDAKTSRITHSFDKERFEMNKRHQLKLTITDYRGNSAVYEASFWK